jgi:hypothetical protein
MAVQQHEYRVTRWAGEGGVVPAPPLADVINEQAQQGWKLVAVRTLGDRSKFGEYPCELFLERPLASAGKGA